jgi:hypothetical protein
LNRSIHRTISRHEAQSDHQSGARSAEGTLPDI